jgi:hypothetical protein
MREVNSSGPYGSSRRTVALFSERTHRVVWSGVGVWCVLLGLSLTFGVRTPWEAYLPLVLVISGLMLAVTGLVRPEPLDRPSVAAAGASDRYIADALVICPSCSARAIDTASVDQPPSGAWRVPDPAHATPVPPPSALTATTPGDFLWTSWLPPAGKLPVELIGPVAETAYVPPKPGAPVLYEEGEPIDIADLIPILGPEPEPTPPLASVPDLAPAATVSPSADYNDYDLPTGMPGWKEMGFSVGGSLLDPMLEEALNPTPPHLRPPAPLLTLPPPEPPLRPWEVDARSLQCADCRDPVPDPANWRRCLDCHRALCADCMVSALVVRERAWCSHCAERRGLDSRSGPASAR